MSIKLLSSLIFLLAGCGQSINTSYQDPNVMLQVLKFEGYYKVSTKEIEIVFTNSLDHIHVKNSIGVCFYGPRRIELLKPFWDIASEKVREALVFHELGHCLLNLEHRNENYADGCAKSFMRSETSNREECYDKHYEEMVKELWT